MYLQDDALGAWNGSLRACGPAAAMPWARDCAPSLGLKHYRGRIGERARARLAVCAQASRVRRVVPKFSLSSQQSHHISDLCWPGSSCQLKPSHQPCCMLACIAARTCPRPTSCHFCCPPHRCLGCTVSVSARPTTSTRFDPGRKRPLWVAAHLRICASGHEEAKQRSGDSLPRSMA